MPTQDLLSPLELEHLAEVREVTTTANSAGWMRIQLQMEKFVNEAKEDMVGNLSGDPMTYMRFQLRWQQRETMLRGVKTYIEGCQQEKQMLLESTQRSVPPEYAEQDRDIA